MLFYVPNNTNCFELSTLSFSTLHTACFLVRFMLTFFYVLLPGAIKGNKLLSGSPMDWTRHNGIKLH